MKYIPVDTVQETRVVPFGLHLRQILQPDLSKKRMVQSTHEPEITTSDGNDPDKIDVTWYDDEDEEEYDDDDDDDDDEGRGGKQKRCALSLNFASKIMGDI